MLPNTSHSLEKLELLCKSLGFKIRYEKGNFKSGACVLETSKVIIVNRFLNIESRISAIADVLAVAHLDEETALLNDKQKQLLMSIKQTRLKI